jgi:hypothetical protein
MTGESRIAFTELPSIPLMSSVVTFSAMADTAAIVCPRRKASES